MKKLEQDKETVKDINHFDLIKKFVKYYHPHKVVFAWDMISSFFISAIALIYPIITQMLLNTYIPEQDFKMIWLLGGALFLVYLIRTGFRYYVNYYGHVMGVKMQGAMRLDMFKHLQELPYSYYDNHETGKIMSRMTNDLFEVSELAHHGPENFFISGFMLVITLVYLGTMNLYLTLIISAVIPVVLVIAIFLRKAMAAAYLESRKSIAKVNADLENSISGIRVTKAFTNKEKEIEKFNGSNNKFISARTKAYKAMARFSSSTQFVTDIFNIVVLIAGALFMAQDVITFDVLVVFIVSVNLFIGPLRILIGFTEQFEDGIAGFKRFNTIMDEKPETDIENPYILKDVKGEIIFDHVSFEYSEAEAILKDINMTIKPGDKFALVGPSGGGKTTICHLIPRFYPLTYGKIKIDGISNMDISFNSLRQNIGIVQQNVFLFEGTIKENILYGKVDATDAEVELAAKRARLYDYVEGLPDKFETEVGERGVKLSGGQKQRISIARVFLKDPAILILDEATSALDNTTEILIQEALDELCAGRTTIIVAHRLSTIKSATKIAVISKGEIVELGSHQELIKNDNGIYKELYELQFRDDPKVTKLEM